MSMSLQDIERLQALYPENQIELREGKLILQKTTLRDDDILALPELFPGWEIAITNFGPLSTSRGMKNKQ